MRKAAFSFFLASLILFSKVFANTDVKTYWYDANHVRYEQYQTDEDKPYNWLFFPGGPGADSRYLHSLIDLLKLPGNVWLVDLPGNGSNQQDVDFNEWFTIFPKIIEQFQNPILVGHSFGGMFPLFFPELENSLKGLVILHSSPALWLDEAAAYSKQFDLPDLRKEMEEFTLHPSHETFKAALDVCMLYYFPKETLEKGRALLSPVPFEYTAAVWWQRKVMDLDFSNIWVPQNIPTSIVGAKYDCVCPFSLFAKDKRFQRPNIELTYIENGGHLSWIENPEAVRDAFKKIISRLEEN